jgi:baculoviral IAP repeat-containing protein 2/3
MKLRRESVRLRTFKYWNPFSLSKAFLAKAGFFYFNKNDEVQCAFCLGIVQSWKMTDDPFLVHQARFPLCQFVSGRACGNVPLTTIPIGLEDCFVNF